MNSHPHPVNRLVRNPRLVGALALLIALAGLLPLIGSRLLAADDKGDLLKDQKETAPADAKTRPAATPASQPTAQISPEAQKELDQLGEAYKKLESLRLAGTIASELDIAGQHSNPVAEFSAMYQSPMLFRHSTREGEKGDAKETMSLGNNGEKLYAFNTSHKYYLTAEAPKARTTPEKLGKPFNVLLERQDPSLLAALSEDPAGDIARGEKTVDKIDDVKIDGTAYPALKLVNAQGRAVVIAIDPKTHLIRRMTYDLKPEIDPDGKAEVKKAETTVDYTESQVGADVKKEQFAWTPPEGSKDLGAMAAGAGAGGDEDAAAMALEGKDAPAFTLKDAKGKTVSLADLKGSVVVLDFWATWCGPCRMSLPHLNELYEDKKAAGLKTYAINLREDPEQVQKFVKTSKLTIPVLFDSDGKTAEKYAVTGIPQTVVIGKDGKVKKIAIGAGTHDDVRKAVEEAMK